MWNEREKSQSKIKEITANLPYGDHEYPLKGRASR